MRRVQGQNLIEFLIIVAVVAVGGIFALTMLGGNINEMFAKSTEKQANFDPFDAKNQTTEESTSTTPSSSTNPTEPEPEYTVVSSEVVDGYNVDRNSDGSVSLSVGSQTVNISAEMLELNDTVFETSGASGGTLISAIAYMIEQNESEYPESEVPVQISYGQGVRDSFGHNVIDATYEGSASANTVAVSVGDNVVIYQKDQSCEGSCSYSGIYRIEGTIAPNKSFSTNKVTTTINGVDHTGTYSADTTTDASGATSFNGIFNFDTGVQYNWNIDFDNLQSI